MGPVSNVDEDVGDERRHDRVMVRVDESGEGRAALKVDDPGRASGPGRNLRQSASSENLTAADRQRLGPPPWSS